jgi:3-phenylpropionate/trans-cinnamate dioxygenase ferredoxin reductase subunit
VRGVNGVVIVGASVAGIETAAALRDAAYDAPITIVGDETALPYDKPPLSKGVLTRATPLAKLSLRPADWYASNDLQLVQGVPAVGLHDGAVQLADGSQLHARDIVIATGARARRLGEGAHVVRTLNDALELAPYLTAGSSVVVVGAGYVGAEVAASAHKNGAAVTVVESAELPFAHALGAEVALALRGLHAAAGVELRYGQPVRSIRPHRVELADGLTIAADVVVAGLGAVPNVGWLHGSGVELGDGVLCDAVGRTNLPGVYAVGDVAAWPDPVTGLPRRHEHWTRAREQARVVAAQIAGTESSVLPAPYFWSDQYGRRIQSLGDPAAADARITVRGPIEAGPLVVLFGRQGRLVGAVGVDAVGALARCRSAIEAGVPFIDHELSALVG